MIGQLAERKGCDVETPAARNDGQVETSNSNAPSMSSSSSGMSENKEWNLALVVAGVGSRWCCSTTSLTELVVVRIDPATLLLTVLVPKVVGTALPDWSVTTTTGSVCLLSGATVPRATS